MYKKHSNEKALDFFQLTCEYYLETSELRTGLLGKHISGVSVIILIEKQPNVVFS